MKTLYPLKFRPIYKEKIWGGSKIRDVLGKDFGALRNCGESWEISGVPGDISIVANGPLTGKTLTDLMTEYKGNLVGEGVYQKFGDEFPLLIKFIDANEDLSIQVHPDDALAKTRHNTFGKTEMWYILQADPKSTLISGFNRSTTKEEYLEYFHSGRLMELLNKEEVSPGDVFYLPAGRVHTIGTGLLLAEIQQTSDVTYRIYDFDRVDDNGNKRELHTEEALEALDYSWHDDYKTNYNSPNNSEEEIITGTYFKTSIQQLSGQSAVSLNQNSFTILLAVEGAGDVLFEDMAIELRMGESILIPASISSLEISSPDGITLLKTHVPT